MQERFQRLKEIAKQKDLTFTSLLINPFQSRKVLTKSNIIRNFDSYEIQTFSQQQQEIAKIGSNRNECLDIESINTYNISARQNSIELQITNKINNNSNNLSSNTFQDCSSQNHLIIGNNENKIYELSNEAEFKYQNDKSFQYQSMHRNNISLLDNNFQKSCTSPSPKITNKLDKREGTIDSNEQKTPPINASNLIHEVSFSDSRGFQQNSSQISENELENYEKQQKKCQEIENDYIEDKQQKEDKQEQVKIDLANIQTIFKRPQNGRIRRSFIQQQNMSQSMPPYSQSSVNSIKMPEFLLVNKKYSSLINLFEKSPFCFRSSCVYMPPVLPFKDNETDLIGAAPQLRQDNWSNRKQVEELDKYCRICKDEGYSFQGELITPCNCEGEEYKYVHSFCLQNWILFRVARNESKLKRDQEEMVDNQPFPYQNSICQEDFICEICGEYFRVQIDESITMANNNPFHKENIRLKIINRFQFIFWTVFILNLTLVCVVVSLIIDYYQKIKSIKNSNKQQILHKHYNQEKQQLEGHLVIAVIFLIMGVIADSGLFYYMKKKLTQKIVISQWRFINNCSPPLSSQGVNNNIIIHPYDSCSLQRFLVRKNNMFQIMETKKKNIEQIVNIKKNFSGSKKDFITQFSDISHSKI